MRLTKKQEAEIKEVLINCMDSYLAGDLEKWASFLADSYHNIGTNEEEVWSSKQEILSFSRKVLDQLAGMVEIRDRRYQLFQAAPYIMAHEFGNLHIKSEGGWVFYSKVRLSSLLDKTENGWKVLQQHGSYPDNRLEQGEFFGFQTVLKENTELRDAVNRRTTELELKNRELEIEKSLEKVRAVAMGMQQPDDMLRVCKILYNELKALGFDELRNAMIHTFPVDTDYFINYDFSENAEGQIVQIPRKGSAPIEKFIKKISKSAEAFQHLAIRGKELEDWVAFRKANKEAYDPRLDKIKSLHYYNYSVGSSAIGISTYSAINKDQQHLLQRFRNVFKLAYQRYNDISLAAEQAREARIETALERVRSRSLAMHKSGELLEVAYVLFQQLRSFGGDLWGCGISLCRKDSNVDEFWFANENGILPPVSIPNDKDSTHKKFYEGWRNSELFLTDTKEGKQLRTHYDYMGSLPSVKVFFQGILEAGLLFPTWQRWHAAYFSNGYLMLITTKPYGEEQLLVRFARVFEQAYTRFLDLQKAEAQARESEIELALERVRARTMAMQHSDELREASFLLNQQVLSLGIKTWGCAFDIYREKDSIEWFGNEAGLLPNYTVPRVGVFKEYFDYGKKGNPILVKEFAGEKCTTHYEFMSTLPGVGDVIRKLKETNGSFPDYQIDHVVYFKYGYLLFVTVEPVPESYDIFIRFAKVFEQTYTRFLDLQKAEVQTRQAQIEVALERVRARALAMQQPEELKEVAEVLRHEMGSLGVEELETCSIYIHEEQAEKAECWYALKDLHSSEKKLVSDHFSLNLEDTWVGREMLSFYNSNVQQVSIVMQGDRRKEWIRYCEANSNPFRGYYGEVIPDRTYHLYKFSHGSIGAASGGDISAESWDLLRRASAVFSLAFSRFKDLTQARIDLKRLKEEKQRAEEALNNLQAAQKQLVQAEKMASLGELTAGIAHEIQNPLNFVNNFSEVSRELLEEMKEAMENGDTEEAKEIMIDVIQNLEKINHHGKRADGIVKGMLQHSRNSSGVKEPTDINALCDEYLRLSYHGLRAKDKSFNARILSEWDDSIGLVNIIPQDIGRVVLNLLTNAFYAVDDRKKSENEKYEPTVWISTENSGDRVMSWVRDNGNGIRSEILDKIFQPFFTTKPSGKGTGLGLSLSYDIVTKGHGGVLKVESKTGKGSSFIIELPVNN